jgi:hypothetical protein
MRDAVAFGVANMWRGCLPVLNVTPSKSVYNDIVVGGAVTPADWGSPHDRLEHSFVVSKYMSSVAQSVADVDPPAT